MPLDEQEATEILRTVMRSLGLDAEEQQRPFRPDIMLLDTDGRQVQVEVKSHVLGDRQHLALV